MKIFKTLSLVALITITSACFGQDHLKLKWLMFYARMERSTQLYWPRCYPYCYDRSTHPRRSKIVSNGTRTEAAKGLAQYYLPISNYVFIRCTTTPCWNRCAHFLSLISAFSVTPAICKQQLDQHPPEESICVLVRSHPSTTEFCQI
jgi:hypothetical protein